VKRAVAVYRDKGEWARLVRTALGSDFSWRASAGKYADFYRDALAMRASGLPAGVGAP